MPSCQDYTLTLYLHQHWKDERLAFSEDEDYELTLGADFADKIWTPDSFLANVSVSPRIPYHFNSTRSHSFLFNLRSSSSKTILSG